MSCHHLICLEEEKQDNLDDDSEGSHTEDPFLDLMGTGLGYIDAQLGPSLTDAAKVGHVECLELLVKAGAAVNTRNARSETPLLWAAFKHNICVKFLMDARDIVNTTNTLRNTFKEQKRQEDLCKQNKCIKILVEAGASVNIADNNGLSPIIAAACCGNVKLVELLIQAGADVNIRTIANCGVPCWESNLYYQLLPGTTALLAAALFRHSLNTFKALLKSGARVNVRAQPQLNALETTFSTDDCYSTGVLPPEDAVSLLHAAGETTDGTSFYELDWFGRTARFKIDFPKYLLQRLSTDTLKDVCREAIRKHLLDINQHLNLFMRIPQLGLPTRLTNYLLFDEDLKVIEEDLN